MGLRDWSWWKLAGLIFMVIFFVAPMFVGMSTPENMPEGQTGFQFLTHYYEQVSQGETPPIGNLMQFLVVPWLVTFVLILGVLESGVGRFFPERLLTPLALLFAATVLFTNYFVQVVMLINMFGTLGLLTMAIIGLIFGSSMTYDEWKHERKKKKEETGLTENEAKLVEKERNLEQRADEINQEMLKIWKRANKDSKWTNKTRRRWAEEIIETPITDFENLDDKVARFRREMKKDPHDHTAELADLASKKHNLAKKMKQVSEQEAKEIEKDIEVDVETES